MVPITQIPQVTVLGSLNMDLVSYVPHHPLPGETLSSTHFTTSPGGKGANQAIACTKLSRDRSWVSGGEAVHVSMVGAVGNDPYGNALIQNLAAHGTNVDHVKVLDDVQTGVAIIIVDQLDGQNRIILSPGANHSVQFDRLPDPLSDLLVMQLEIPLTTVLQALKAAHKAGVPVLLNPAPAIPLPDTAYQGLAHLIVNETEASLLSGISETDLSSQAGLSKAASIFLSRGVQTAIITLGGRGVYYANERGEAGHVPAGKVKVVDTTAAGDTFIGAYAIEVVMAERAGVDFDVGDAVGKANRAAARTVGRLGAQDSIPWRDEV